MDFPTLCSSCSSSISSSVDVLFVDFLRKEFLFGLFVSRFLDDDLGGAPLVGVDGWGSSMTGRTAWKMMMIMVVLVVVVLIEVIKWDVGCGRNCAW